MFSFSKKQKQNFFIIFVLILILLLVVIVQKNRTTSNKAKEAAKTIVVSSTSTSENQILAHMIMQLIQRDSPYSVKLLNNLASPRVEQAAMLRGQISISTARYSGSELVTTIKKPVIKDSKKVYETVKSDFKNDYGLDYYPSYGFSNQYSVIVTKELAQKYHLQKISDLQKISKNLSLAVDNSFLKRPGDGYEGFRKEYQMNFKKTYPMQVGLLYDALKAGEYDVIVAYSTDGRIPAYDLKILQDDFKFFPEYSCSMIVDPSIYQGHPKLKKILHKLDGKIDDQTMQELNYQADKELIEPEIVAQNFLEKNNYFSDKDKDTEEIKDDKNQRKLPPSQQTRSNLQKGARS